MNILNLSKDYNSPLPFEDVYTPNALHSGSIFHHENGLKFTLIFVKEGRAIGVLDNNTSPKICVFKSLKDLHDLGFKLDLELVELVQKERSTLKSNYAAITKLKDGKLAGICKLVTTCAIVIDWDQISAYESRYCYSHTHNLGSFTIAMFWLTQLKTANSLPIGNVAYRGQLGTECIVSEEETKSYYDLQHKIKYEFCPHLPTTQEHAMHTNQRIIEPLFENHLKFSSAYIKEIDALV